MDSVCHVTELPSAARGTQEGSNVATCTDTEHKPAHCIARWQPSGQVARFHAPRATGPLAPLNCSRAPAAGGSKNALCHPKLGSTLQQNSVEPSKKSRTAAQVGPIHTAAKRSGASAAASVGWLHAVTWQCWSTSVQTMTFFASSSALEKRLTCKAQTLHALGPLRYDMYHACSSVHGPLPSCKTAEAFLAALQATAGGNTSAQPGSMQQLPHQACNSATSAAGPHDPPPRLSSAWEQFMDAEAETSQAAAENDSPTGPLTAPNSLQKPLSQPDVTDATCGPGLQSGSLAALGPGSKTQQQAQNDVSRIASTSRSGTLPQAGPIDTAGGQHQHTGNQPSSVQHKPDATPAATACKLLVPVFSKHKQRVFKPPAAVPAQEGNSQCKAPSRQTNAPVHAALDAGKKPAFVFDEVHAMARHVAVPTSFASLHSYQHSWCGAVTEEINIRCTPQLFTVLSRPKQNATWIAFFWVAWVTGHVLAILVSSLGT